MPTAFTVVGSLLAISFTVMKGSVISSSYSLVFGTLQNI